MQMQCGSCFYSSSLPGALSTAEFKQNSILIPRGIYKGKMSPAIWTNHSKLQWPPEGTPPAVLTHAASFPLCHGASPHQWFNLKASSFLAFFPLKNWDDVCCQQGQKVLLTASGVQIRRAGATLQA